MKVFEPKKIKNFALIVAGTLIASVGVSWFVAQSGLMTGGVVGFSIIFSRFSEQVFGFAPVLGLLNLVFSLPIFVFSFAVSGMKFVKKSLVAMVLMSLWLSILSKLPSVFEFGGDPLCAIVCAGVCCGAGTGMILKGGASTGGTDMLANELHKIFPQFAISTILFVTDFFIICCGLFFYDFSRIIYSIVMVFVCSRVVNNLTGGLRFARVVYIFSEKTTEISNEIFEVLNRGNTQIECKGMYSKKSKQMLMVAVMPNEIVKLKSIIESIDKNAFVAICPAQEILGNGF